MKRVDSCRIVILCMLMFTVTSTALLSTPLNHGTQDARTVLFKEVEETLGLAKTAQADIFSPNQFSSGFKDYQKADDDYKKGKNLDNIRRKIASATSLFLKAIETTKLAKIHFNDCVAGRNDALAAEAPQYRNEDWMKAEELLTDAAKTLEKGDLNRAQARAAQAEQLYRQVELESIKANYLDETKILLESREKDLKKLAPLTLAKAQKLIVDAERILVENRYDTDQARQLAQEAQYEAAHAIYLAGIIDKMKEDKTTVEAMLLDSEVPVQSIANNFDINAKFNEGYEKPVQAILTGVQGLRKQISELEQDGLDKQEQIDALVSQVAALNAQMSEKESQLDDLKTREATMAELMEQQRLRREKFARVESTFTTDEAEILRQGDKVIIRLYGLSFPVGKSTIESQYFGLLSKVITATAEYPEYLITIEGHTDSHGGDAANLKLSKERSDAVRDYLMASGGIVAERINAEAYGESKPIASNETKDGRTKNRRIEVVIHPKE